jgi:hypothetical protein
MQVSKVAITASPNGTVIWDIYTVTKLMERSPAKNKLRKYLSSDSLYHSRQIEVFGLACFYPWRKPTQLPIIAVVGKSHFRTDEEDLAVENDDSAVIENILVDNRPIG